MNSLNFLPKNEHRIVQAELRSMLWNRMAWAVLSIIVSISVLVWVNEWTLQKHDLSLQDQIAKAQTGQASKETTSYEAQIREFNTKVKTVSSFTSKRIPWSNRLAALMRVFPDSISAESIIFDAEAKTFSFRATARDRDAYLALKDALVSLDWFTSVDPPINDLLTRQSIKFTLSTGLTEAFSSARP